MKDQKYWVAVVSKEHTERGVAGSFIQVQHGKQAPLKRMNDGDWLMVYSPKLAMESDVKYQAFTAIGQVNSDDIYQFKMSEAFIPYRRNINFYNCEEAPVLPLINELQFIPNKKSWGFPFRFGFFEICKSDFELIHSKMLKNETL